MSAGPMMTFWINGWEAPLRLSSASLGWADKCNSAPPAHCNVALAVVSSNKTEFGTTLTSCRGCNKITNNCNCSDVEFPMTASRNGA